MSNESYKEDTQFVHRGRDPAAYEGVGNPPVVRSSTILYPSLAAYEDAGHKYRYGRTGNPLSDQFEQAMSVLENGYGAISAPSGLSAITTALTAFLNFGDHLLVADNTYPPTRSFCDHVLKNYGVEVEYYDPLIGAGIAELIRDNTAVIYMESPGSDTLEIQDVPAITKVAREKGVLTMIDNTWSAGILFKPLDYGVNLSIQAATKYISGHSDVNLGFVVADNEAHYKHLKNKAVLLGICAGGEDMYLALRGVRTLKMRMKQAGENALKIAQFLQTCPEVTNVLYPALPDDPHYKLWRRDFTGANGIVSFILQPSSKEAKRIFIESLKLFPIGSSWGGYESLIKPQNPKTCRSAVPWTEKGALLRLQVGLEDPDDLIEDLSQGFGAFRGVL